MCMARPRARAWIHHARAHGIATHTRVALPCTCAWHCHARAHGVFTALVYFRQTCGLGPTVSEVMPISICSPKSMGKKLPNELWARPVASKLSERRPLTFFHRRDTENGKKRYFFAFLQITPMQKFS